MEPATTSKQHVPPCEVEEMNKEQQAVVDRYREQQDTKSKSVPAKQTRSKLVYNAEQRKALELLASVNCPVAQRDTVW